MDIQEAEFLDIKDAYSTVDTSRPFRSVKEAVAIFGERILAGDLYAPKTLIVTTPKPYLPPSPPSPPMQIVKYDGVTNVLRKLESELEDTKRELNLLKERETETEIALASLNAELHKNMAKMAGAEAAAAASSSSSRALVVYEGRKDKQDNIREEKTSTLTKEGVAEKINRIPSSSSLAHMLCLDQGEEGYFGYNYVKQQKKKMKKKPIVPLFGDFFSRKKSSRSLLHLHDLQYAIRKDKKLQTL